MNKYIDDSRLGEKILDIILPAESVYKENKGEPSPAQIRHGRIDEIYTNRKDVNTRYGDSIFRTEVKIYFRALGDTNSEIIINMFNYDDKNLYKKFVIKSKPNDYTISDMKGICDGVTALLTGADTSKAIMLIEHIRGLDVKFEEFAQ